MWARGSDSGDSYTVHQMKKPSKMKKKGRKSICVCVLTYKFSNSSGNLISLTLLIFILFLSLAKLYFNLFPYKNTRSHNPVPYALFRFKNRLAGFCFSHKNKLHRCITSKLPFVCLFILRQASGLNLIMLLRVTFNFWFSCLGLGSVRIACHFTQSWRSTLCMC